MDGNIRRYTQCRSRQERAPVVAEAHNEGGNGGEEHEGKTEFYLNQLKTPEGRVLMFAKIDLPAKWSARRKVCSRKDSYTRLIEVDEHVRGVQLLPDSVSARAHARRKEPPKK